MSDSSDTSVGNFQDLRQRHVCALTWVLSGTELATRDHVERRYNEQAEGFDKTLAFLEAIGGVESREGSLHLHQSLAAISPEDHAGVSAATLRLLAEHDTCYRREMQEYLGRFRPIDGAATYRPPQEARSAESGVRNFLIDLGVVKCDGDAQEYVVRPEHSDLYVQSRHPRGAITPAQLRVRLRAREDLGLRAEMAVWTYERRRVGQQFEREVRHVAAEDVGAGYDILSVTLDSDQGKSPRYIEVKAVPSNTWRFYWTANELAMAELFGAWYYLYLVPAGPTGCLDIAATRILADPCARVLGTDSEWAVEKGVLRCSLDPARRTTAR